VSEWGINNIAKSVAPLSERFQDDVVWPVELFGRFHRIGHVLL
jgi:hypothetical protein